MTKTTALLSSLPFVAVLASACGGNNSGSSSPNGGGDKPSLTDPNFTDLRTTLTTPTGTLKAGSGKAVIGSLNQQVDNSTVNPFGNVANDGDSKTQSESGGAVIQSRLGMLGDSDEPKWCSAFEDSKATADEDCNCPGGGTLHVTKSGFEQLKSEKPKLPINAVLKGVAKGCTVEDVTNATGTISVNLNVNSETDMSFVFAMDFTHDVNGAPQSVYLYYLQTGKSVWFPIKVDDGVVTASKGEPKDGSATITIKAKGASGDIETWTCTVTGETGNCTSDKGGSLTL